MWFWYQGRDIETCYYNLTSIVREIYHSKINLNIVLVRLKNIIVVGSREGS